MPSKCGFFHGYFSSFECNVTWYYHYFHPTSIFLEQNVQVAIDVSQQKKSAEKRLGGTNSMLFLFEIQSEKAESEPQNGIVKP